MTKIVYAQISDNADVLIILDEQGNRLELTGPEMKAAEMTPGA